MITYIILFIIAGILAMICHEMGHSIVCKLLTEKFLSFHFEFGWLWIIPVPRFIWYMPSIEYNKQKIIAMAGFITELAIAPLLFFIHIYFGICYGIISVLHFILYPYYAGESSDFKWFK